MFHYDIIRLIVSCECCFIYGWVHVGLATLSKGHQINQMGCEMIKQNSKD